jgi:hypothetical protein
MYWRPWPNAALGQLYSVDRIEGTFVRCKKGGEEHKFRFAALDRQDLRAYRNAQYVFMASKVSNPEPVRRTPTGGWEIWIRPVGHEKREH